DTVQNNLGRLAIGLAVTMNEAHKAGYDLSNAAGGDFFTDFTVAGKIVAVPNKENSLTAAITVKLADTLVDADIDPQKAVNKLTADDYRVSVKRDTDGTILGYEITSIPGGVVTPGPLEA